MANKEISDLPAVSALDDEALFVIRQDGAALKMTVAQLKDFFSIGEGGTDLTGAVRYDITQVLDEEDLARARENLGIGSDAAVLYVVQSLTAAQQSQARANIGAADASNVYTKSEADAAISTAISAAMGDVATALSEMDTVIGGDGA